MKLVLFHPALAFVLATATFAPAQNAQPVPTFSSRTELVTVPVVVTDKSGAHMQNLKQEDFILLEDGKPQKIAHFEEIAKAATLPKAVTPKPGSFTNISLQGTQSMQLSILVLDLINTPVTDQMYARQQILKYLAESFEQNQLTAMGTFQTFAQATGGRAFYNTNDLKGAFQKAADDNASYYVLSYYLERKDKKPGWHRLGVKVDRHGAEVRARNGFFLQKESSSQLAKTALEIALKSPLEYTGIPITGRWQQVTPAAEPGKKKVVFVLTMPANFAEVDEANNNHVELEIAAVARTATRESAGEDLKTMDGHLKLDSLKQIRESGLDYRGALTLAPGEYTVHFAVQDQLSGRMGSVNTPLKVEP